MFLLAPFAQAFSGLLLLGSLLVSAAAGDWRTLLLSLGYVGVYVLGATALAAILCLLGGYGLRGMGRTVLLFPVFMASWLPLQVLSLFRDTRTWHPVAHGQNGRAAVYRI